MTNKKYKLLDNDTIDFLGMKLHRIEALKDFGDVRKGYKGGYVQSEINLSHSGNSWVSGNAGIYGYAMVLDDAEVYGNALVYGDAKVFGNAKVFDDARVYGDTRVYGNAKVFENAQVYGDAWICSNARVYGDAKVYGDALVCGDAGVCGDACVSGDARLSGNSLVRGDAHIDNVKALITISPIGSENGILTAYKNNKGGISVNRGCFSGTLEEFKQSVKKTHGKNKHAKTYKLAIELIKSRLEA